MSKYGRIGSGRRYRRVRRNLARSSGVSRSCRRRYMRIMRRIRRRSR